MRRYLSLVMLLALLLAGCSIPGQSATPEPIIVVASPTPSGGSSSRATPTTTGQSRPTPPDATAGGQTGNPTPEGPTPEAPTTGTGGTITMAFDAFPSYYPAILIETQGLLKKRGYELKLVPFLLDGQNDFS